MIKRISFLLITLFFISSNDILLAQSQREFLKNISDTAYQKVGFQPCLKASALILPGTLLLYGALKPVINAIPELDNNVMASIQQNHPGFHTNAADFIMWVPSASVYAMDALHVKTEHNFREHLIIEAASVIITGGIGYGMGFLSRKIKVNNTNNTKFPSGHTANAFRGAEIVHQELKNTHPAWSYSGYLVATGVGMLRIYGKEHLLTEVIAGAGLGILSTKLTYWIFGKVR